MGWCDGFALCQLDSGELMNSPFCVLPDRDSQRLVGRKVGSGYSAPHTLCCWSAGSPRWCEAGGRLDVCVQICLEGPWLLWGSLITRNEHRFQPVFVLMGFQPAWDLPF